MCPSAFANRIRTDWPPRVHSRGARHVMPPVCSLARAPACAAAVSHLVKVFHLMKKIAFGGSVDCARPLP